MRSEAEVLNDARLAASRLGWRLWRNNKGAGYMQDGSFIRWGLCNETNSLGSHMRSADLIGIRPLVIGPEHIGLTIGQFVSLECKREGWRPSATNAHEIAQRRWADLVVSLGGHALITSTPESIR